MKTQRLINSWKDRVESFKNHEGAYISKCNEMRALVGSLKSINMKYADLFEEVQRSPHEFTHADVEHFITSQFKNILYCYDEIIFLKLGRCAMPYQKISVDRKLIHPTKKDYFLNFTSTNLTMNLCIISMDGISFLRNDLLKEMKKDFESLGVTKKSAKKAPRSEIEEAYDELYTKMHSSKRTLDGNSEELSILEREIKFIAKNFFENIKSASVAPAYTDEVINIKAGKFSPLNALYLIRADVTKNFPEEHSTLRVNVTSNIVVERAGSNLAADKLSQRNTRISQAELAAVEESARIKKVDDYHKATGKILYINPKAEAAKKAAAIKVTPQGRKGATTPPPTTTAIPARPTHTAEPRPVTNVQDVSTVADESQEAEFDVAIVSMMAADPDSSTDVPTVQTTAPVPSTAVDLAVRNTATSSNKNKKGARRSSPGANINNAEAANNLRQPQPALENVQAVSAVVQQQAPQETGPIANTTTSTSALSESCNTLATVAQSSNEEEEGGVMSLNVAAAEELSSSMSVSTASGNHLLDEDDETSVNGADHSGSGRRVDSDVDNSDGQVDRQPSRRPKRTRVDEEEIHDAGEEMGGGGGNDAEEEDAVDDGDTDDENEQEDTNDVVKLRTKILSNEAFADYQRKVNSIFVSGDTDCEVVKLYKGLNAAEGGNNRRSAAETSRRNQLLDNYFAHICIDDIVDMVMSDAKREENCVAYWNLKRHVNGLAPDDVVVLEKKSLKEFFLEIRDAAYERCKIVSLPKFRDGAYGPVPIGRTALSQGDAYFNSTLHVRCNRAATKISKKIIFTYETLNDTVKTLPKHKFKGCGFISSSLNPATASLPLGESELLEFQRNVPFSFDGYQEFKELIITKTSRESIDSLSVARKKQQAAKKAAAEEKENKKRRFAEESGSGISGLQSIFGDDSVAVDDQEQHMDPATDAEEGYHYSMPLQSSTSTSLNSSRQSPESSGNSACLTADSLELSGDANDNSLRKLQGRRVTQPNNSGQILVVSPVGDLSFTSSVDEDDSVFLVPPPVHVSPQSSSADGPVVFPAAAVLRTVMATKLLKELFEKRVGVFKKSKVNCEKRKTSGNKTKLEYAASMSHVVNKILTVEVGTTDGDLVNDIMFNSIDHFMFCVWRARPVTELEEASTINTIGDGLCMVRGSAQCEQRDLGNMFDIEKLREFDEKLSPADIVAHIDKYIACVKYRNETDQAVVLAQLQAMRWHCITKPGTPNPIHSWGNSMWCRFLDINLMIYDYNLNKEHFLYVEDNGTEVNHQWGLLSVVSYKVLNRYCELATPQFTRNEMLKVFENPNYMGFSNSHFYILGLDEYENRDASNAIVMWVIEVIKAVRALSAEKKALLSSFHEHCAKYDNYSKKESVVIDLNASTADIVDLTADDSDAEDGEHTNIDLHKAARDTSFDDDTPFDGDQRNSLVATIRALQDKLASMELRHNNVLTMPFAVSTDGARTARAASSVRQYSMDVELNNSDD